MSEKVGLEGMSGLILDTILSKLDPRDAATVACVSTRLRHAASEDSLWRIFCSRDFAIFSPLDPESLPCPSFKVAYEKWFESFGMYPLSLVSRVKQYWDGIKRWLDANFPEAKATLRKGASEDEIKQAEGMLGLKLPIASRVLYRFCDGQATVAFQRHLSGKTRMAPLGIIGGYEVYNHLVNVHLLPLSLMVEQTRQFRGQFGLSSVSNKVIVALSYYEEKLFFLNCSSGQLYVGTSCLLSEGEMVPCVPQALIKLGPDLEVQQDALLLWLEEHRRRLQSGVIKTRGLKEHKTISLFPESRPMCSTAVTNGVQVRASAIFVPELSSLSEDKYLFAYSIRMSLLPNGCLLDSVHFDSCQLHSRHWIIKTSEGRVVADVHGEAVIGKYPILRIDAEEFVYESCSDMPSVPGSIEGSFTFVPGSLVSSGGKSFEVKVARFELDAPGYVF